MRVPDFLAEQHVVFETILHPPAYTAQKRARFMRVPGKQVAKCVLLLGPRGYLLAVLPATHHVNTDKLAAAFDGPVRLADDREIAEVFRDCEWGVVPPFGTLYELTTLLDTDLDPEAFIVFESNSHAEAVRMRCRDFIELERPRRLSFSRRSV
jgi:Ala-tRNA(Pro) deacylase